MARAFLSTSPNRAGIETPPEYYGFTVSDRRFSITTAGPISISRATPRRVSTFTISMTGRFEEMGLTSGLAVNEDGREQAGMGATAADYDGDGRLDIFKTNFSERHQYAVSQPGE